jgi:hypothetical protein
MAPPPAARARALFGAALATPSAEHIFVIRLMGEHTMPEEKVRKRATKDKAKGKSPTTQAGEFVREEIHHNIREGKHGARSAKQAIAIGLSKARQAGVDLPPPDRGRTSETARRSAQRAYARGHGTKSRAASSPRRKRAARAALEREGHAAASRAALSKQARSAAARKRPVKRSEAARKAARTKGRARRKTATEKE